MTPLYRRRTALPHETLLLSLPFQLGAGVLLGVGLPAVLVWGLHFWTHPTDALIARSTVVAAGLAFMLTLLALQQLRRYPGTHVVSYIVPTATFFFLAAAGGLLMTRSPYSRPVLLAAWLLCMGEAFATYFLSIRWRQLHFAVVPLGLARELQGTHQMQLEPLSRPDLGHAVCDGIVADLGADDLDADWQRFLARSTLAGIPVYHVRQIEESISGRVRIRHMAENELGALLPSPLYLTLKHWLEVTAVLLTLPITLPLMALTAVAIRLESPGPVLFVQPRVGQGDRDFTLYKFRSMRVDAEKNGAQLACTNDARITRLGHLLRKTRLDELPQFFNVLKGDMSLIGPRPEQRAFVQQFDELIPFYSYRHVVRPGITGWAQVMQGYAGNTEDTRLKLQYDLFYIKHFSLWLDILIGFKTLRILVTGKGAR